MSGLCNHLWQSTLFAACVVALNFLLRRHRAHVRYWLWLAASLKFLVPFSVLVSLGGEFTAPAATPRAAPAVVREISQPLAPVTTLPIPDSPRGLLVPQLAALLWLSGTAFTLCLWFVRWRRIARARANSTPLDIRAPILVRETRESLEPGVCGLFRPVLLLPSGIAERLTPAELAAVLAHECCHVRRRDNLTAALHMIVQAAFWFHPLVWWIGARLVEERELACDEAVLGQGSVAESYANGILNVCRFYLESPLPCAPGVSGADLKKRIATIMNPRTALRLGPAARAGLGTAGLAAIALPLLAGLLQNPPDTLKFEVATIRESKAGHDNSRLGPGPGGVLQATNVTLYHLIAFAYDVRDFQISGLPGWAATTRFDVVGKPDQAEPLPDPKKTNFSGLENAISRHRERMRNLLAERFQFAVRRETREAPVYALTVAKGGHKLKEVPEGIRPPNMRTSRGSASGSAIPIRLMAEAMSGLLERRVVDETGLTGMYDFELHWTPEASPNPDGPVDAGGPSIFTAFQEQLGLRLESKRAPIPAIVVMKVERPSAN